MFNNTTEIDEITIYNHSDKLGLSLCIAIALHAALILGITFGVKERIQSSSKLEITLAQYKADKAPDDADFLAQTNQAGSGSLDEKAMLQTTHRADFHSNEVNEIAQQTQLKQNPVTHTRQSLVVTFGASNFKVSNFIADEEQQEEFQDNQDMTIEQRSQEIASLEAKLDIQTQAYAKRPRMTRLTSVATKQAEDALYLHRWRERIETVGNLNYPEQARQKGIYGQLRLVVSIMPDGSVLKVEIIESSGHKILDEAAIRIVHLASPFDSFTPEMQKRTDILEIIRTWRFHEQGLSSQR